MKWQALLAVAFLLSSSTAALCEETAKPIAVVPPGDDVIVPLPKGATAPFSGQLYDDNTALRWANWLRQYKLRLKLDVREQQQLCAIQTELLQQQLVVEKQKYDTVVSTYEKRVSALTYEKEHPAWYNTPTFYVGAGVVGTAFLLVGSAMIVNAAK